MNWRRTRWVALVILGCVPLTACVGIGGDDGIEIAGQKVNGVSDATETVRGALDDYANRTGVEIENAECHLRLTEVALQDGGTTQYPISVDCLPVAFLGDGGLNAVSFSVGIVPDPERPKDLWLDVDADDATALVFEAAGDSFRPDLPEKLPAAGQAVVPDGMVQVGDMLVLATDLASVESAAQSAIALDSSHAANTKFTMGGTPTCGFSPDLEEIWCGPGLSLTSPEGEVASISSSIPALRIADYARVGDWRSGPSAGEVYWQSYGSQPINLIDATGKPASLPPVDSIDPPELPTIDAGVFVDVSDESDAGSPCLRTGRAAGLCDDTAVSRFDTQPNYLRFISGRLEVTELAIGKQTGSTTPSDITMAERAASGETLVAFTAELSRDRDAPDTEPLDAQVLVGDKVMDTWNGVTGSRGFFMSVPTDEVVRIRLDSSGETQDLVVSDGQVARATGRPELYEEKIVKFSTDQRLSTAKHADKVRVKGFNRESDPYGASFMMIDGAILRAAPGHLLLGVIFRAGDSGIDVVPGSCELSLALADGTTIAPTTFLGQQCVIDGNNVQAIFEMPANADVAELRVQRIETTKGDLGPAAIPTVPG